MWVGVSVYSSLGENAKSSVDQNVLTPINPTLDQEVVVNLTNRLKVVRVEPNTIQEIEVTEEVLVSDDQVIENDTIEDDGIR